MSIAQAVLQLAIGVSFGLLLFLLASGFTLTFGLAGFVNLSHGAVFMVSAYVATAFQGGCGPAQDTCVSPIATAPVEVWLNTISSPITSPG